MSSGSSVSPLDSATTTTHNPLLRALNEDIGETIMDDAPPVLAQEPTPATQGRRPDARTTAESRLRTANDPLVQQLMQRAESKVKPRAFPPGTGPFPFPLPQQGAPQGTFTAPKGGKGGLFKPESKETTAAALRTEGQVDPAHPYAVEAGDQQRRFEQLGLPRTGTNRLFIQDLAPDHAAAIARTVGGQTALAQGADIATDAPKHDSAAQAIKDETMAGYLKNKPNATVTDLATLHGGAMVSSVYGFAKPIKDAAIDAGLKNDGKKTFMTMSWGASAEGAANQTARTMLMAPKGTKLYDQTVAVLGHEATLTKEGDRTKLDAKEVELMKRNLIYPALDKEMATPRFKTEMAKAKTELEATLAHAKQSNVMVFQAAGNDFVSANAAGRPDMATNTTAGVKGLFLVGASQPNGAGTADDQIAPFSSNGAVTASATGMALPVGVKDGKAVDVNGTSFASPLMAQNAYVVSAANPRLSIDEIQRVLTDPRVARDIAGTTRDGAGVVDPLAASLVAKYPRITAAQIDQIRAQLDQNPNAKFIVQSDGTLRQR